MSAYYLIQHLFLALGLALFAVTLPKWFHVPALPRALIAASLTPQLIGLLVMLLALFGVRDTHYYIHLPVIVGLALIASSIYRLSWAAFSKRLRFRITPAGLVVTMIGVAFVLRFGSILFSNAESLNVIAHDFNVYLSAAKVFAASPGVDSIPTFYGDAGDVIVVHPHSFIYEAYFSQSLMYAGEDAAFPPLDFLTRLAQQLTVVYLLVAIAGTAYAMGGRWSVVAVLCLAVSIPVFYYMSAALSRDAFRMTPVFGFIVVLASLSLNFRSTLVRRGMLAGVLAALVIMSHTLGIMLGAIVGVGIVFYALIQRRPSYSSFLAYIIPLLLLSSLAIVRYVEYYIDTGGFMGYGLQYSIYQGTWLEPILSGSFADNDKSWSGVLDLLFHRYGIYVQSISLLVSILAVIFTTGRGMAVYTAVLIAFWFPLVVGISGLLDYSGINLKDALIANRRYGLSFFLLSAPLLGVGVARLGKEISTKLGVPSLWRQTGAVLFSCAVAWYAHDSLKSPLWRSKNSRADEILHIQYIGHALGCLSKDENWFVDGDRWNPYFNEHPPLHAFTLPARPLLTAKDEGQIETIFHSMKLKFAVFIEGPGRWHGSPLYEYMEKNWERIPLTGGFTEREIWIAPMKAGCIGVPD